MVKKLVFKKSIFNNFKELKKERGSVRIPQTQKIPFTALFEVISSYPTASNSNYNVVTNVYKSFVFVICSN